MSCGHLYHIPLGSPSSPFPATHKETPKRCKGLLLWSFFYIKFCGLSQFPCLTWFRFKNLRWNHLPSVLEMQGCRLPLCFFLWWLMLLEVKMHQCSCMFELDGGKSLRFWQFYSDLMSRVRASTSSSGE